MPLIYIYFNETTNLPAFLSLEKINTPLKYKEVNLSDLGIEDGNFNLARFKFMGDFETGKLVDLFKEKKAIVTEEEIDNKYYGMFFRKYPLEKILMALIRNTLKAKYGDQEMTDMEYFLKALDNKKQKELEFFKNSDNHIFESTNDQEKRVEDSFKL